MLWKPLVSVYVPLRPPLDCGFGGTWLVRQWELPDVLGRSVQRFRFAWLLGAHTSVHSGSAR